MAKDIITKKQRSALMTKIKSQGTAFELGIFKALRKFGVRFEKHPQDIFGHPDLVIRNKKICVFLDSDFWHGWQYPRWKNSLNRRWKDKIEGNRKRDKKVNRFLRRNGWVVIRLREHGIMENISRHLQEVLVGKL